MSVIIREYRESDRSALIHMMQELQDHLISVDTFGLRRRLPEYGESYTERLFTDVRDRDGVIYIAEEDGIPIGCGVCVIARQTAEDLLEQYPVKTGRVTELHILEGHRGKGAGTLLMQRMEAYFRDCECVVSRTEVLSDNTNAREFYEKNGYANRYSDVIKKL